MDHKPVIAAFDFDGTVTYHDSLLPFLVYSFGVFKTYAKLLLNAPTLIGFVLGIVPRQKAKEVILAAFFKGEKMETVQELGRKYASKKLNDIVRPEAKERILWHQSHGHQCVLISASLDVYLTPWAEALGFNKVISSTLDLTNNNEVTGKLLGANCWGSEKIRRLEETCGPSDQYTLYAYGDSRGDQELLNAADSPFYRSLGNTS